MSATPQFASTSDPDRPRLAQRGGGRSVRALDQRPRPPDHPHHRGHQRHQDRADRVRGDRGTAVAGNLVVFVFDGTTYWPCDNFLVTVVTPSTTVAPFYQSHSFSNLFILGVDASHHQRRGIPVGDRERLRRELLMNNGLKGGHDHVSSPKAADNFNSPTSPFNFRITPVATTLNSWDWAITTHSISVNTPLNPVLGDQFVVQVSAGSLTIAAPPGRPSTARPRCRPARSGRW